MPQSGASLVAGALSQLGVFFGAEAEFFTPSDDDPGGRLEQRRLNHFCWRCLSTFQMHTASIGSMPASWRSHPQAVALRAELKDILAKTIRGSRRWGIKLPLASLLTPIFKDVFEEIGASPHYVVCVRSPFGFGMSPIRWAHDPGSRPVPPLGDLAMGVWLRHTLGALDAAEEGNLSVVPYEDFIDAPQNFLNLIVEHYPQWMPTKDQWSAAVGHVRAAHRPDSEFSGEATGYPGLVAETLDLCRELGRGERDYRKLRSLIREFDMWRQMLAPPGNPGTQLGFAWTERGEVRVAQVPFLPSGDWQTVRLSITAPPDAEISGLFYGRPCRVWIRRCFWRSSQKQDRPRLIAGPGSQIVESGGLLRLDGSYEPKQVSLKTPHTRGPFELEFEFLLEAGPQISVEAARRLSDRLQQCAAAHDSLSTKIAHEQAAFRAPRTDRT
jgi:hypothetical protein